MNAYLSSSTKPSVQQSEMRAHFLRQLYEHNIYSQILIYSKPATLRMSILKIGYHVARDIKVYFELIKEYLRYSL